MRRGIVIFAMAAGLGVPAAAQLNLSGLDGLAARAKDSVEITLDANLLQMAGGFLSQGKADDAKAARAVLSGLRAITVRTFEFDQPGQYRPEDVEAIRNQLRAPAWTRILRASEGGDNPETAEIYTRTENGRVTGFAIIAAEARELAIIAIDGNISLEELASLGGQFGIPNIPIPNPNPNPKGKQNK